MFPGITKKILQTVKGACGISDEPTRNAFENMAREFANVLGNPTEKVEHTGTVDLSGPFNSTGPAHFGPSQTDQAVTFDQPVIFNDSVTISASAFGSLLDLIPFEVQLTADMVGGSATAKKVVGGSVIDPAFTITDPSKMAGMAFTGHRCYVTKDRSTGAYKTISTNAPHTRIGTISGDLTRGGTITFTDSSDGEQFTINGALIKMGTKAPQTYTNGGTQNLLILAEWCQARDSGNGEWTGTVIDDCLVTA